jgi:hypothetical protein
VVSLIPKITKQVVLVLCPIKENIILYINPDDDGINMTALRV